MTDEERRVVDLIQEVERLTAWVEKLKADKKDLKLQVGIANAEIVRLRRQVQAQEEEKDALKDVIKQKNARIGRDDRWLRVYKKALGI